MPRRVRRRRRDVMTGVAVETGSRRRRRKRRLVMMTGVAVETGSRRRRWRHSR